MNGNLLQYSMQEILVVSDTSRIMGMEVEKLEDLVMRPKDC